VRLRAWPILLLLHPFRIPRHEAHVGWIFTYGSIPLHVTINCLHIDTKQLPYSFAVTSSFALTFTAAFPAFASNASMNANASSGAKTSLAELAELSAETNA